MKTARFSIMNTNGEFFEKAIYVVGRNYEVRTVGNWAEFVAEAIEKTLKNKPPKNKSSFQKLKPGDFLLTEPEIEEFDSSKVIRLPAEYIGLVNEEILLILEGIENKN